MSKKVKINVINNEKAVEKVTKTSKKWLFFLVCGIIGLVGGISCLAASFLLKDEEIAEVTFPQIPSVKELDTVYYSSLTGEALSDEAQKTAPAYCIQTPNGTDGARPQSGLTQAGVIFEAIAEAGITRFAAIYQNPSSAVIGPIRSLRMYYLDWDVPFDCTIVHAGGASDALSALAAGGYKELDESYVYMYRGTNRSRLWNNLFTTSEKLRQFSNSSGYKNSDIKGFARLTPDESDRSRIDRLAEEKLDITKPALADTSKLKAGEVNSISVRFGGVASFNVHYDYDSTSNTYLRSYENGAKHEVYKCPESNLGEKNPEDVCELTQMAPSVVIAMVVPERRAADNYHEDITTIGTGNAYIFQNGTVIVASWSKASRNDQIKFYDKDNKEVSLAPGQTIISAVPNYGSVDY